MKIIIPQGYVNNKFSKEELKVTDIIREPYKAFTLLYLNNKPPMKLFNQEYVNHTKEYCNNTCTRKNGNDCSYPDCGESTLEVL